MDAIQLIEAAAEIANEEADVVDSVNGEVPRPNSMMQIATLLVRARAAVRMERKQKNPEWWVFTVIGNGAFPFDMLRYDGCWPVDSHAAANIQPPGPLDRDGYRRLREVRMYSLRKPTHERWASFGWGCTVEKEGWQ